MVIGGRLVGLHLDEALLGETNPSLVKEKAQCSQSVLRFHRQLPPRLRQGFGVRPRHARLEPGCKLRNQGEHKIHAL